MTPAELTKKDEFYSIYWKEYNAVKNGGIIRMCEQVAASGNTLILYSA